MPLKGKREKQDRFCQVSIIVYGIQEAVNRSPLDHRPLSPYHTPVTSRAVLIYNPAARGVPAIDTLEAALDDLAGWETSLEATERAGHATELARAAAERGVDVAIACGGDGTVNEVANGLAGSSTALAVVRGGTANVWAKEIHLPRKPAAAIALLANGERRTIDLGRAGERYFLLMAGLGFDSAIVRKMSSVWKRRLGAAAYLLFGIRASLTYRSTEPELLFDGETAAEPLYWLLLGNTRNYGGLLNITNRARADDGQLDLFLLRKGGLLRLAWIGLWAIFGRHQSRPEVLYRTVRSLDVRTAGLPVQVDGEYVGETPMRFEVVPAALQVIVPRGLRSPLFESPADRPQPTGSA